MSKPKQPLYDKSRHPQTLTSIVANTFNYAVGCGISEQQIDAETGLKRTDLVNPESWLPEELVPMIWQLMVQAHPGRALTLHMASGTPLSFFGQLNQAMQYAEDVRSALQTLVDYRSILSGQLHMELVESGSEAILRAFHPNDAIDGGCGTEVGIAILKRLVQQIIEIDDYLIRTEFAHRPFGLLKVYENYFGVPILFQQPYNALVFRREVLHQPTQQRDPYLFKYIQGNLTLLTGDRVPLNTPALLSDLYHAIDHSVALADYRAEVIAKQMNMSLRAVQRLAQGQGFTISQLLDNAREEKARQLLTDLTLSVQVISAQLGYSDDRAFRRAFKRWTGQSPTEFRRGFLGG